MAAEKRGRASLIAGDGPKCARRTLVEVLNDLSGAAEKVGTQRKCGADQLADNAASILEKCIDGDGVSRAVIGSRPCRVATLSKDGRGRCQRAMRVDGKKFNFRPTHIVWIAANGPAPTGKQYSHRCHEENCCEPTHGVWETDAENKSRNACRTCSHVVLSGGRILVVCPHEPACLVPVVEGSGACQAFESAAAFQASHLA